MTKIRIRNHTKTGSGSWVYSQEVAQAPRIERRRVTPISIPEPVARMTTNQFGRFQYSQKQYGEIQRQVSAGIEIDSSKIRIKTNDNSWIYNQGVEAPGRFRSIRIKTNNGPWVYVQEGEVFI